MVRREEDELEFCVRSQGAGVVPGGGGGVGGGGAGGGPGRGGGAGAPAGERKGWFEGFSDVELRWAMLSSVLVIQPGDGMDKYESGKGLEAAQGRRAADLQTADRGGSGGNLRELASLALKLRKVRGGNGAEAKHDTALEVGGRGGGYGPRPGLYREDGQSARAARFYPVRGDAGAKGVGPFVSGVAGAAGVEPGVPEDSGAAGACDVV